MDYEPRDPLHATESDLARPDAGLLGFTVGLLAGLVAGALIGAALTLVLTGQVPAP